MGLCSNVKTEGIHSPKKNTLMGKNGTPALEQLPEEPQKSAEVVGLRYVTDEMAGLRREPNGRGFKFFDAEGKLLRDPGVLVRIKSLAIPPAWRDVWICPYKNGHLQATGRDARGRKQHRYHPRWREIRDETKYTRMLAFAKALPRIRKRVNADLKLPGLSRNRVLAAVVKLLEVSLIRVGNEEYVKENRSYGLTTLRNRHAEVRGNKVRFEFRGKSGKEHSVDVEDPRLAQIVKTCQDLPGQDLFEYLDAEGQVQDVRSEDVNNYLQEITGQDFTAKDFRTWNGTVLAALALQEMEKFDSRAEAKKNLLRAIEAVAQRLGNTPAVCRKCYIHPAIMDCYLEGALAENFEVQAENELRRNLKHLSPEEAAVLVLLQQRLAAQNNGTLLKSQLAASIKAAKKGKSQKVTGSAGILAGTSQAQQTRRQEGQRSRLKAAA